MEPLEFLSVGGLIFQAAAYLALSVLLLSSWGRERAQALIGALLTATAVIGLFDAIAHLLARWLPTAMPALSDRLLLMAWLAVLATLSFGENRVRQRSSILAGAVILVFGLASGDWAHLGLLLAGFALVERTYRKADYDQRFALKLMLIGISAAFAAELVIVLDELSSSASLEMARPAGPVMQAVAVPFIAASIARRPDWSLDIHVSRRAVFGGVIATAAALYTLITLSIGAVARDATGAAGTSVQIILVLSLLALGGFVLLSGHLQAALGAFVSRTFFSYRFDYRDEWARFVRTLEGASAHTTESLADRVIFAVADVVEATGGAVWLAEPRGRFTLVAVRNLSIDRRPDNVDPAFATILADHVERVDPIDLVDGDDPRASALPSWIPAPPHSWLLLPLYHRERLFGIMVLAERRMNRALDREERDLLGVVAREAASYLAEDRAARRLTQVERFESFNRRFAFVMHDVKNVSAQLALTLSNARRHRGNEAFYDDMLNTLDASVARMNALISRIRSDDPKTSAVRLDELLADIEGVRITGRLCPTEISANPARLRSVLNNLVDNAREACGECHPNACVVEIRLSHHDGMAVVEVSDNGPGMDPAFVRTELFEPFTSTKPDGMGLGMADVKETIESMGGQLEVDSAPGAGSTMRILLPARQTMGKT
ncbi:MAG: PEP-CTERM system histidine kinase PrsK [Geminicoccaceae bacterium]|nr:PEP-CTERM system histidine kinase PrsK [Geminicoccaceae bacterium]